MLPGPTSFGFTPLAEMWALRKKALPPCSSNSPRMLMVPPGTVASIVTMSPSDTGSSMTRRIPERFHTG